MAFSIERDTVVETLRALFALGLGLTVIGCFAQPMPEDAASDPSPTFAPAPNDTPSPRPSNTPTPAPTPELAASIISDDFLFESSSVPGCKLPCWQGLEVGTSGREDIQVMFDAVFAFNGTHQFIPDILPTPVPNSNSLPEDYYAASSGWFLQFSEDIQSFSARAYYERDTFTLRGLWFGSSYKPFNIHLSPYRIIRELGQPSYIPMLLSQTESGDVLRFEMWLVYDSLGMVFGFGEQFLPGSLAIYPDHIEGSVTLCLDDETWNENHVRYRTVLILDPLEHGLDISNPLQRSLLPSLSRREPMLLTDFFNVSLEDITQMALEDNRICLHNTFSN